MTFTPYIPPKPGSCLNEAHKMKDMEYDLDIKVSAEEFKELSLTVMNSARNLDAAIKVETDACGLRRKLMTDERDALASIQHKLVGFMRRHSIGITTVKPLEAA